MKVVYEARFGPADDSQTEATLNMIVAHGHVQIGSNFTLQHIGHMVAIEPHKKDNITLWKGLCSADFTDDHLAILGETESMTVFLKLDLVYKSQFQRLAKRRGCEALTLNVFKRPQFGVPKDSYSDWFRNQTQPLFSKVSSFFRKFGLQGFKCF